MTEDQNATEAVAERLFKTLGEMAPTPSPAESLPGVAWLLGFVMAALIDSGHDPLRVALVLRDNVMLGGDAYELGAKKRQKRSRGLNKKAAVKAVEDLFKAP